MKTKFNLIASMTSFCLPFSVLTSCQATELKASDISERQVILPETALMLPKTGVYDDGEQHLIFDDKPSAMQRVYKYYGETINNANLAANDQDPLSMMKGKDAIELRKNDTLVVNLNFINTYRQAKQEKNHHLEPIVDFTDVWYKYFAIIDTKAAGAGADSWQHANQVLWTEDISIKDEKTNHKLEYNNETNSYFASIKATQDVWNPETLFQQDNVFELKLASDKQHLFVTCHYDQPFVHDYFSFVFINLDHDNKRMFKGKYYQMLWQSSWIMCNLDKTDQDPSKIIVNETGWDSSIIENLKKDKWLGYLMGTKSINPSSSQYYNCMLFTPSALHKDSFWYYYAKYTAIGVKGFKGYSKQVEPIKLGS